MLALLLALPSSAQDAPKKKDDNPNITCIPGWSGYYRPQRWMPLRFDVVIENPTRDWYDGTLRVVAQQDSLVKMTVHKPALVTKNLPLDVTLAVKTVYDPSELTAEFYEGPARRWSENIASVRTLKPLRNQDKLFVVVKDTGPSALGQMAQRYSSSGLGQIAVSTQPIEKLPDDWAFYDAVDLVILQDPQWSRMTAPAQLAMVQWIHRGGKLLIVPGSSNPLPNDHAIAAMLPFAVDKLVTREIDPPQVGMWDLAGSRDRLAIPSENGRAMLAHWDLSRAPASWQRQVFNNSGHDSGGVPWVVTGHVGLGRVSVVAFNPDTLFQAGTDASLPLWAQAVNIMGFDIAPGTPAQDDDAPYYHYDLTPFMPGDQAATNSVIGHLLAIPELRPLSIWWVVGLLSALALLLGPIDYLVLRKFDRLPWTWITSTAVIVLFSVGAWYGVQRIRGGTLQVRVVSVIDGVEAPGAPGQPAYASATYYGGIFAPDSDNYALDATAQPERATAQTTWWSAISPESNRYRYDDYSLAGRQITCTQDDSGNRITDLPVSIWSMQCLINETQDTAMPVLARVIDLDRAEGLPSSRLSRVRVIVTNLADRAIVAGDIRIAGGQGSVHALPIDKPIPPGGMEEFEGEMTRVIQGRGSANWRYWADASYRVDNFSPTSAFYAAGTSERTEAIEKLMNQGAAVVTVRYDDAPLPFQVAKRSNDVAHIQMARLVVWPTAGQ